MKVRIVFGTTEGPTRKISGRVAARIRARGHDAELHDGASLPADLDVVAYDAVILAASLHQQRHQSPFVHFVGEHLDQPAAKPAAFLSVSLSSVLEKDQHEAEAYVQQLLAETQPNARSRNTRRSAPPPIPPPSRGEALSGQPPPPAARPRDRCYRWLYHGIRGGPVDGRDPMKNGRAIAAPSDRRRLAASARLAKRAQLGHAAFFYVDEYQATYPG